MNDQILLESIINNFCFEGKFDSVEELHSGNINNSYCATFLLPDGGKNYYTIQHINSFVFKDPHGVMHNIEKVTQHLQRSIEKNGVDPERRVLKLIKTTRGDSLFQDENNGFWRAFRFINGATAHDSVVKEEHFFEAGRAFGEFQRLLYDFPAQELNETIPGFHDTPKRYITFEETIGEDRVGRAAQVGREIAFFRERQQMMGDIVNRLNSGDLPLRVTHNDTKINNVLIDDATDKAICVIDLDTVMPGSSLYDYGDAIRYGASTGAEDEKDLSKISLDLGRFERFTRGFLQETNGFLTQQELHLLPLGVKVITCELAMRFLTDYLDGDRYFKTAYPEHNLVRARAQMRLLEDVEQKSGFMDQLINQIIG